MKKILLFSVLSLASLLTFAQTIVLDENECLNYSFYSSDVKPTSSSSIVVKSCEVTDGDIYQINRNIGNTIVECTLASVEDIDNGVIEINSWQFTDDKASYFYGYFKSNGEFVSKNGNYNQYLSVMQSILDSDDYGMEFITGTEAAQSYTIDERGKAINPNMYYHYIDNWSLDGIFPVTGIRCYDGGTFTYIPMYFQAGVFTEEPNLRGFTIPSSKKNKAKNYFLAKEKLPGTSDADAIGMFLYSYDCSKLYAVAPTASGTPDNPAKYTLDNATKEIYTNAFANCHDIEIYVSSDVTGESGMGGERVVLKYLYPVEGVAIDGGLGFKITSPITEGALNKALRETDEDISLKSYKFIDATEAKVKFDVTVDNCNPNQLFFFSSDTFESGVKVKGNNVITDDRCASLVLTDKASFYNPYNFSATKATYNRAITANSWGSIILPYTVPEADIMDIIKVAKIGTYDAATKYATFKWNDDMSANNAYIFKGLANATAITSTNVSVSITNKNFEYSKSVNGLTFTGVYKEYPKGTAKGDKYGVQISGGIMKYTDDTAIYPFRAYLTYPTTSEVKVRFVEADDEDEDDNFEIPDYTAIVNLSDIDLNNVIGYYTLSGVKIDNLQKGYNLVRMNSGAVYKVLSK